MTYIVDDFEEIARRIKLLNPTPEPEVVEDTKDDVVYEDMNMIYAVDFA